VEDLTASEAASGWVAANLDWTLLSAHADAADAGGRSQDWEMVLISDKGMLTSEVQDTHVINVNIIVSTSPASACDNVSADVNATDEYSQDLGDESHSGSTDAVQLPIDTSEIMSRVLELYKVDMRSESTPVTIHYDGSNYVYTVSHDDPIDLGKSYTLTYDSGGKLLENRKAQWLLSSAVVVSIGVVAPLLNTAMLAGHSSFGSITDFPKNDIRDLKSMALEQVAVIGN
jgi:hypothetical protein